jgi:hypothetical protein
VSLVICRVLIRVHIAFTVDRCAGSNDLTFSRWGTLGSLVYRAMLDSPSPTESNA